MKLENIVNFIPKRQTGMVNGYRWHLVFPEHTWEILNDPETPDMIKNSFKNGWCAYITVPYEHPMFGMTTDQLIEEQVMNWDPEITWADYCPWMSDDKGWWLFGWDYQREQEAITITRVEEDINSVIQWVEDSVSSLSLRGS